MEARTASKVVIYVKKADPNLLAVLAGSGEFSWSKDFAWHRMAPMEDDTFPELLLDVRRSLELFEAGRLNQARDKYARFLNRMRNRDVVWMPVIATRHKDARRLIKKFFDYKKQDHIEISQPSDYENMLVLPSPAIRTEGLIQEICYVDDVPCALLVMEQIGKTNVLGLYCNLALYQEYKYLSESVVHRALILASEKGFRYLNLGGSESEGLNGFKTKFQPIESIQRDWLVFNGHRIG